MNTHTLTPCPFCGGTDNEITPDELDGYVVTCTDCQGHGPTATDRHHAAKYWNDRAED